MEEIMTRSSCEELMQLLKEDKDKRIAELEAELTECREERDKLRGALEIIVSNATMIDDPTMEGITDCFRVPLEDIEVHAHGALIK